MFSEGQFTVGLFGKSGRLLVLAALAFPALGAAQSISIASPISFLSTQTFGMVGLAAGQTAQVNALSTGISAVATPDTSAPAFNCLAQLTFLDSAGKPLKTANVSIAPGQSASLGLNRDLDLTTTAQRVEVRAIVQALPNPAAGALPFFCTLTPTLEVFDNSTGKTTVILESTRVIAGPLSFLPPGIK